MITGGNRGIGAAVASKMAARGYRVVIGARDATAAQRAAAAIGGCASGVQIDVSDEASV
jgi:NAD(P)-dependent dehydrogenase (short-subunit alcohol dehydrogenase family)